MPNGNDKNWVRVRAALEGFFIRHRRWPTQVRVAKLILEDLRGHILTPTNWARIAAKLQFIADDRVGVVAEDAEDRYDYGADGFPRETPSPNADEWLGVALEMDGRGGIIRREPQRDAPRDKRRLGSMLGLAVGDALGAAVEFKVPGTFPPVTGYRDGGPHGLAPGEWTDDTSMALALADSLASAGFDVTDQARRYQEWCEQGRYSVNGRCFDMHVVERLRSADTEAAARESPETPQQVRFLEEWSG